VASVVKEIKAAQRLAKKKRFLATGAFERGGRPQPEHGRRLVVGDTGKYITHSDYWLMLELLDEADKAAAGGDSNEEHDDDDRSDEDKEWEDG
jgi:hypothetical protein